jgi:hypothetical protein
MYLYARQLHGKYTELYEGTPLRDMRPITYWAHLAAYQRYAWGFGWVVWLFNAMFDDLGGKLHLAYIVTIMANSLISPLVYLVFSILIYRSYSDDTIARYDDATSGYLLALPLNFFNCIFVFASVFPSLSMNFIKTP